MPRLTRKRPAPADIYEMEDSESEVRVRTNGTARNQRRRTTESPASESEGYVSESGAATQSRESMQSLAQKLVRYAMSCEYSRMPIRRADIGAKVLAGGHGRQFKEVFAQAQFMLETTFGMRMEELPVREKVTNAQKRAAEKSDTQTTNSNSWVLVSTLPQKYRDPSIIPPPNIPTSNDEANYVGLYTFIISLIYLSQDRLPESKLDRHLNQLNLEQNTPIGPTDKLFKRMEKEGYIVKSRDNSSGEEIVEYLVGPRGKVEVPKEAASEFIRTVWGPAADTEEGFDKKLEKSLGLTLPQRPAGTVVNGVGGSSAPRGRRRREPTATEQESEEEDESMSE